MLRIFQGRALRGFLMTALASTPLLFAHADTANAAERTQGTSVKAHSAASNAQRTTLRLLNVERSKHGLRRLHLKKTLTTSARRYSRDMVRRNFFAHISPSGSTPAQRIRKTGYLRGARAWHTAENIAWGVGANASPEAIVRAWMNSPGHRANILDGDFRHIGIGIAAGAPGYPTNAATYTTHFGSRR
jgi:uncharacterized protein YkwD